MDRTQRLKRGEWWMQCQAVADSPRAALPAAAAACRRRSRRLPPALHRLTGQNHSLREVSHTREKLPGVQLEVRVVVTDSAPGPGLLSTGGSPANRALVGAVLAPVQVCSHLTETSAG